MAGFLLLHRDAMVRQDEAVAALQRATGGSLRNLRKASWSIWLASHRLPDAMPWLDGENGSGLAIVGTCVVAGLSRKDGRHWILDELNAGRNPSRRLRGAFILLHWQPDRLVLLRDSLGVAPIFSMGDGTVWSSSLLALVEGSPDRLRLDAGALLQQVALGYPLSPRTLFHGLRQPRSTEVIQKNDLILHAAEPAPMPEAPSSHASRRDHIDWQLKQLRSYFDDLAPYARECQPNVGVSGGYDSRLLLLLLREAGITPTLHTLVKSRSNPDYIAAKALAQALGYPLMEHAVPAFSDMDEAEAAALATANVAFYDGRPIILMDLFNPEYSASYRSALLGEQRLSISGVGGEIFRNFNYTRIRGCGALPNWIGYHLVDARLLASIPHSRKRERMLGFLAAELRCRLDLPHGAKADLDLARRHLGNVWLSDWHGHRNSAENRLAGYLSPFADELIVNAAWRSRHQLGVNGEFEAGMITVLDPKIAALVSSYGHALDQIPFRVLLRSGLRVWAPNRLKLCLALARTRRSAEPKLRSVERTALDRLQGLRLPFDLNIALVQGDQRALLLSLGWLLDRLGHRLDTSDQDGAIEELLRAYPQID